MHMESMHGGGGGGGMRWVGEEWVRKRYCVIDCETRTRTLRLDYRHTTKHVVHVCRLHTFLAPLLSAALQCYVGEQTIILSGNGQTQKVAGGSPQLREKTREVD